jgi:hypothetical protein
MSVTSGSQISTINYTKPDDIGKAAREKASAMAKSKTPEPTTSMTKSDPVNINASKSSSTIQNMPTASDKAGVEFYLTRMGFPKVHYTQTSRGATLR